MEREDVKQALLKAYEAGWRGSLELKDEYAEDAVFWLLGPEEEEEPKYVNTFNTAGWTIQTTGTGTSSDWAMDVPLEVIPEIPEVVIPEATISFPGIDDVPDEIRFEDDI